MRRIIFYNGFLLRVFEWRGHRLLGAFDFTSSEKDVALFKHYLDKSVSVPTQLLVDSVEEDFRLENVPHVGSGDQKLILDRHFDRLYRDSEFRFYERQYRNKGGRKDDAYVLAAFSKTEGFDLWLNILEDKQVYVSGIWSVSLLSKKLQGLVGVSGEHLLMVLPQMKTSSRQIFFKSKFLYLSRQSKLSLEYDSELPEKICDALQVDSDQIYKFLTNQRVMGFNDNLTVVLLGTKSVNEYCEKVLADIASPNIQFHYCDLKRVFSRLKLKGCEACDASALMAYLCSRQSLKSDHYSHELSRNVHSKYVLERSVRYVSTVGSFILFAIGILLYLKSMVFDYENSRLESELSDLEVFYERHYFPVENILSDSEKYKNTALLVDQLKQESQLSVLRLFKPISDILEEERFASLHLTRLDWDKVQGAELSSLIQSSKTQEQLQWEVDNGIETESFSHKKQPIVKFYGDLKDDDLTHREVVILMRSFIERIKALPNIEAFNLVKSPVDVRPEVEYSDKGGMVLASHFGTQSPAQFEFSLRFRGQMANE